MRSRIITPDHDRDQDQSQSRSRSWSGGIINRIRIMQPDQDWDPDWSWSWSWSGRIIIIPPIPRFLPRCGAQNWDIVNRYVRGVPYGGGGVKTKTAVTAVELQVHSGYGCGALRDSLWGGAGGGCVRCTCVVRRKHACGMSCLGFLPFICVWPGPS